MKRYFFSLTIILLLLTACEREIELSPVSQTNADNFYKTATDIDQAVTAAYDALQTTGQYRQNFFYFMEVASDNSRQESLTNSNGVYGDFELFRLNPSNVVLNTTWVDCYRGIQRCNLVLSRIGDVPVNESQRAIYIGEVKFLRALTYFNLVRLWGAVPMVLEETTDAFEAFAVGRTDEALVYEQIIRDAEEAAALLPVRQSEAGRATKGAAQTLLGKIHLTRKNYAQAAAVLREVVDAGTYTLLADYAKLFGPANENNGESIFEVQFKEASNGEGSPYPNLFAPVGALPLVGGIGQTLGDNLPTLDLYNSYAEGDVRKNASIGTINGALYTKKYQDVPAQNGDSDVNAIVFRYADVLLMLAEALNEQGYVPGGEAFSYLNRVRIRAGVDSLTAAQVPDQAAFRQALERERRHELAFENHRWFDLLRTGRTLDVINAHTGSTAPFQINEYQLLFPVPQVQLDIVNNPALFSQNPGY